MSPVNKRVTDRGHEDFVRDVGSTEGCVICGDNVTTELAHVRYAEPKAAKPESGMQIKPASMWTLPLCGKHHREQHAAGDEQDWWYSHFINPIWVCLALWGVTGDHEAGCKIIREARQ